ncbi:lysis protein [Pseudomonas asiatica]|uniref:lysis system i-spanin subunit Rz n=1 Tax=Pseudomonas TaxID=286 RepID=UPI0002A16512|nr:MULTISPECIES: lysis system i-spanin subunit Rz [Pseudomonas]AGA72639.1 lysis protein [Pseudomonas putida HB3267]MCE0757195.1 lysis protein [Pseudomonas asiatica]MCE0956006.1 lysis protein [Pseudomonas asiatica]MCE1031051.1 lysis protein [Pseudomonas asiatica]MCE1067374.1 lysis protein [Pseudomonas asiatica]
MTNYLIAGLLACGVVMYAGWQKIEAQSVALDAATQRNAELEAATASRRNTIRLLADLDTQHTQERERANQTNAGLRADVAAGKRRLSVLATSCAAGSATAAGVGHAEARAELDPAAAERIVAIANDGDDAIRQLSALQDYVRTACPGAVQ